MTLTRVVTDCQCSAFEGQKTFFCERHKCTKHAVWLKLCQTRPKYFQAYEEGRGPGQRQDGQPPPANGKPKCKPHGPGTELTKLFRPIQRFVRKTCPCKNHAREMDRRGCDWCAANIDTIILVWLEEEAKLSGLPYSELVARRIVNLAIRRARRKEKRCAKSCSAG